MNQEQEQKDAAVLEAVKRLLVEIRSKNATGKALVELKLYQGGITEKTLTLSCVLK